MTDEIECSLTANPCRHCSNEHIYRSCTKIKRDPKTNLWKPDGLDRIEIDLGHYCNNVCCWVDELKTCPIPEDLINQGEMIEEYNINKEKERVKEEKRKARKKAVRKPVAEVVKKVIKKPLKKVVKKPVKKSVKKPIKKPIKKQTKRLAKVTKPKLQKKKVVTNPGKVVKKVATKKPLRGVEKRKL